MAVYEYGNLNQLHISEPANAALQLIVTIPACNEPDVIAAIDSIHQSWSTHPESVIELLVLVNDGYGCTDQDRRVNEDSYKKLVSYAQILDSPNFVLHPLFLKNIPEKKAGVGLARKTLMDEASRRFLEVDKNDGIMSCFDADCTCAENYIVSLIDHFKKYPKADACSIYYEHPITDPSDPIVSYELHLRTFIQYQRYLGLPFAYHTVGSSMAVRAGAYKKSGGMPSRQAGEDFYFLQKFIKNNRCNDLTATCVFPSARGSDRVPFGTGKAVNEIQNVENDKPYLSYNPKSYQALLPLIEHIEECYANADLDAVLASFDEPLLGFLQKSHASEAILSARNNTSTLEAFRKRFYQWFDAFRFMKYMHYCRDEGYSDIPVLDCANELCRIRQQPTHTSRLKALMAFRKIDQRIN